MASIIPQKLNKGDTIGIITPASPMDTERLAKGIKYLENQGYEIIIGQNVYAKRGYLAGSDESRAEDINKMFNNADVKAIFCSRGGYGSPRLLDLIDYDLIRQNPKIFVGYSDLTTLQLAIWHKTKLITFSGPMVAVEMGKGISPYTADHLWRTVTSTETIDLVTNPPGENLKTLKPGRATGILLGGCLSTINSLLGTEFLPDFTGAILFLEDIGEEPYRIDRYLAHLRSARILDVISGILLGNFIDCAPIDPEKPSLSVEEIFHDYTANLGIPVMSGLAYGHSDIKTTIPIGVEVSINADIGEFKILEPVVAE